MRGAHSFAGAGCAEGAGFCQKMKVVGKLFTKKNSDGDFNWMVTQPQYEHSLFVYSENVMDSMRVDPSEGGGTAILRPMTVQHMTSVEMQAGNVPRAAGIPTAVCNKTTNLRCSTCK